MFFRPGNLNIHKAGICKKGLYATFLSWHIDPCILPLGVIMTVTQPNTSHHHLLLDYYRYQHFLAP